MDISEIQNLMQKGDYNRALEVIVELEEEEKLDGLILKSRILEIKGELNLTNEQHTMYTDCFNVLNNVILKNKKKPTISKKLMTQLRENTLFLQQLLEQLNTNM